MNFRNERTVRGPIVPALVLIALGILFLLIENHFIQVHVLFQLWPMLLVIAGVTRLSEGRRSDRFLATVLIVLGLVFQAATLGYIFVHPARLWPLAMVGSGVFLLLKTLSQPKPRYPEDRYKQTKNENLTMFGGSDFGISDSNFEGTELTAVFGGYRVDLRRAMMRNNRAIIEAGAIFGGIELLVPVSWNVSLQGSPFFGGYSDETLHPDPLSNAPELIVRGMAVFGGVTVKN